MSDQLRQIHSKFRRSKKLESGNTAEVKVLKMTAGLAVAKKLLNLVAPAIGGAADGMRHDDMLHGAPRSFTHLALTLCEQIDKVQIEDLLAVLLDELTINGKDVDPDEYFADNYAELIEIIELSLRENFSTFFTGKGIKARFMTTIQSLMAGSLPQESEEQ